MLQRNAGARWRRPTLFLAGRNEVSFKEVYSLLQHALLGACAVRHCIDVGLDGPSVPTKSCSQSCIITSIEANKSQWQLHSMRNDVAAAPTPHIQCKIS